MYKNTLILTESDAKLAAEMLRKAIDDLNVVLMLVIGKDATTKQIVDWADKLADKGRITNDYNLRQVVWIRKPEVAPVREILDAILGERTPVVAVLNFHDQLASSLDATDLIEPLTLEGAFLKGHKT